MRRDSVHDEIVVTCWNRATAELMAWVADSEPTLPTARAVIALLVAGWSSEEPEIGHYTSRLRSWVEHIELDGHVLDESSTGLLGLWFGVSQQLHEPPNPKLSATFIASVEHNLQKRSPLCLASSVNLLNAVATGLGTVRSPTLWTQVAHNLGLLVPSASAIEIAEMITSWESVDDSKHIPRLEMRHRLESIMSHEQNTIIEKAVANYAEAQLHKTQGSAKIEKEIQFLDYLGKLSTLKPNDDIQLYKSYSLFLPYLRNKLGYDSLFASWQRYMESSTKRARLENVLWRYAVCLAIIVSVGIAAWPQIQLMDPNNRIAIVSASLALGLLLTTYAVETVAELYGRQLWQKRRVEMFIGIIGALISLAWAVLPTLIK